MNPKATPHSATRQTLLDRVRNQHDEASWEDFLRYYKRYICAVILNMNVSSDDVDDITQNVLLGIWQRLPEFRYEAETCRFRTWLCAVIRNQVVNYCQKQANHRKKLAHFADVGDATLMALPEVEKLAELEWRKHVTDLAWEAVQPRFEGKAIQSFELLMAGHDPGEVAERLGITRNSVYVHRNRVRERMLREINRLNDELS